jgi:cell division GTPase FtsZ
MSIEFLSPEVDELAPRIAVIGVGGAGGNAIANMMRADVQGAEAVDRAAAHPARYQDHAGSGRGQPA